MEDDRPSLRVAEKVLLWQGCPGVKWAFVSGPKYSKSNLPALGWAGLAWAGLHYATLLPGGHRRSQTGT